MNWNRTKSIITAACVSAAIFLGLAADRGFERTASHEGVVLENYYDGSDVLTWCIGETQIGYKPDGNYDLKYCWALFKQRWNEYSARLYDCYNPDALEYVTVNMHVAFTDVYYNTGARCNTSMIRGVNAGQSKTACDAILKYKYAGGKDCSNPDNRTCRGVWKRRLDFHALCLEGLPQ